jgi:hypothetical protein
MRWRIVRRGARALCAGLSTLVACGPPEQQPPPDRPTQPTLTVVPGSGSAAATGASADPQAPSTGRRVVAAGQIAQPWHVGAWSPASITLSEVAAGDAIVVLGAYWGDLVAGSSTAPSDTRGTLRKVVDQGTSTVGRKKPPVFAQLYVELDAAPGAHTIVPPYLGGPAGDGTLYVVQIRGLTEHRVVTIGQSWARGSALRSASVALEAAADPADLLIAVGGYDNTAQRDHAGFQPPPPGWISLGLQDDASNNVPSALWYRPGAQGAGQITWQWTDPTVNVTAAVIAALR